MGSEPKYSRQWDVHLQRSILVDDNGVRVNDVEVHARAHDATVVIDEDIIPYLEKIFPDRSPPLGQTIEQIMYRSGQVSVVQHLKEKLKQQKEEGLLKGLK